MGISRVEDFYTKIRNMDGLKDIKKAAVDELEYLNENCGSVGSLKTTLSIYRSYLSDHLGKKRVSKKKVSDFLLGILKLTKKQYIDYKLDYKEKVKVDNNNLRKIYDVDGYLNKAKSLLHAISFYDRILGLCALTGRRSAEIGCTADFYEPQDQSVMFKGQLKTKGRTDIKPFEIPILANFHDLNKSLASVREEKTVFINNPNKFNKVASKELGIRARKHFSEYIEGHVQVKDLRAIYATIAYENYLLSCNNDFATMSHNAFFSKILGHHEHDLNTCNSYTDFCIRR